MVQRVDQSVPTILGNLANPVLPQDAATLATVQANRGVLTLQPTQPNTVLGQVALGPIALGGTDFRVVGDVTNLVFQGTLIRFASDPNSQIFTVSATPNFNAGTTRIQFQPATNATTGVIPQNSNVFYGPSTDVVAQTLRAGNGITFNTPSANITEITATGGGGGLSSVTLTEPSWRTVSTSTNAGVQTINVTDNNVTPSTVFLGRGFFTATPTPIPGAANSATPNAAGTSTIEILISVTGQAIPGIAPTDTIFTISDSALLSLNVLQIFASPQFAAEFFTTSDWSIVIDANNNVVLRYSGLGNPLQGNLIASPSIQFRFDGNWNDIVNTAAMNIALSAGDYRPQFQLLNSANILPAVNGTPTNQQVIGWDASNARLQWQTSSGGGSSQQIVDLSTPLVADNSSIMLKIFSTTPSLSNVTGNVPNTVADFSAVNITTTPWPPTISPAGLNQSFVAITSGDGTSWGGAGFVNTTPAGITNIAWLKQPPPNTTFTDAKIYFLSNTTSSVLIGTSVTNAGTNPTTTIVAPEATITDLGVNSDTYGARAKQINYQPFIDNRIATQIGSVALPPNATLISTGAQVFAYNNVTRVFSVAAGQVTQMINGLLAIGNGIVQNTSGNWTLPAVPILCSLTSNPTALQYAQITAITQATAAQIQITIENRNGTYFSNASYPASFFTVLEQFNFQAPPQAAVDREVRLLRNVPRPGASQATWGWRLNGDTADFTTQALEAGTNIFFDTDPVTNQPRVNAQLPSTAGLGWIFSIDWDPNNFPVSPAWSGADSMPRMLKNGTIVLTQGINGTGYWGDVRTWVSGNPDIPDTQYIIDRFVAWHNSFSDSLTVSATVEDASGRFQLRTTPPTSDPPSSISDATFQAMWNINNSNTFDHMSGLEYDTAGGFYRYQRAVGSTTIIADTLQQVLNQGNTANNATGTPNNIGSIVLTDVSQTPNQVSSYSGALTLTPSLRLTGATSGNITLNPPATIATPYSLTLPASAPTANNQTLLFTTAGVASFGTPSLNLNTFSTWTSTALTVQASAPIGASSIVVVGDARTILASGTIFSFSITGVIRLFSAGVTFDGTNSTVTLLRQLEAVANAGFTIFTAGTTTVTPFNAVAVGDNTAVQVVNGVLDLDALSSGVGLQQVLNLSNTASTAGGGIASIVLSDPASGASSTFSPAVTNVNRLRLSTVAETNTTDIINSPGVIASYTITLPTGQSNNANNVLYVNASGVSSFGLPSLALQTFSAYTASGFTVATGASAGDTTLVVGSDATASLFAGATFAFSNTGLNRNTVVSAVFANPNTTITLLAPLQANVSVGVSIFVPTTSTATRINTINVSSNLNASVANGVLSIASLGGGGGTIGNVIFTGWTSTGFSNANVQAIGDESITINGNATTAIVAGDNISFLSGGSPRYTVEQVTFNSGANTTTVLLYTGLIGALTGGQTIYKGVIDSTTQRFGAINVGSGLEYSLVNNVLTLINSATGGVGSIPSLDQVTAVGANSTRAITVQATGFNGIQLGVPQSLAAGPVISSVGAGNDVSIAIAAKGVTQPVLLGTTSLTTVSLSHTFSTTGVTIDAVAGSGGGTPTITYNKQVNITDGTATAGLQLTGGVDRGLRTTGSGVLYIGNASSALQFAFAGASGTLTANGAATDISLTVAPKGAGSFSIANTNNTLSVQLGAAGVTVIPTGPNVGANLTLSGQGAGANVIVGNTTLATGITVVGNSTTTSTIQATGSGTDLTLATFAKGSGPNIWGNANGQFVLTTTAAAFTFAPSSTVGGANLNVSFFSKGTGTVTIGNPTNAMVLSGNATNLTITPTANSSNINLTPTGLGNVFPVGQGPFSTAYSPKLVVGTSATNQALVVGNAGQALLSNGTTAGSINYWGSPITGGNKTFISITSTAVGDQTNDEIGLMTTGGTFNGTLTVQINGLNLTLNAGAGTITNWVAGAVYQVSMTSYFSTTLNNARTSYWCANRPTFPQSFVAYGDGVSTCTTRTATPRGGDALPSSSDGVWTPATANTALNLTYFTDALGTGNAGSVTILLIIERLS